MENITRKRNGKCARRVAAALMCCVLLAGCSAAKQGTVQDPVNSGHSAKSLDSVNSHNSGKPVDPADLNRLRMGQSDPPKFSGMKSTNITSTHSTKRLTDEAGTGGKQLLNPPSTPIKAIYVTSHVANSKRMDELIDLVDRTELNAMVLDINSGISLMRLPKSAADAKGIPSDTKAAQHYLQVIQELKKRHIYLIGRIVTFKDPALASAVPGWAIKRKDGRVWRDKGGAAWIDPYRQIAWEYPLSLAEYAAKIGFDEVQYDYVRFPDNGAKVDREAAYANKQGWSKSEVIGKFLHEARERSHPLQTRVSADVFGLVGSSEDDMGIGQKWEAIVKEVDVISPMVYPSHYSAGMWGIAHPDLTPGSIISKAMKDAGRRNKKLKAQGIETAKVRPWLQSFTANWVHPHQNYGLEQVRQQINAAKSEGYTSYMLWNSSNYYPDFGK